MEYRNKLLELRSFMKITVLLIVTSCMLQMNNRNINYVILFVSRRHKMTNKYNKLYVEELIVCFEGHSQGA